MRLPYLSLVVFTLSACVPLQKERSEPIVNAPIQSVGEEHTDTQKEEKMPISRTGTGAIAERLLPSGAIDIGDRNAPLTLLVFTEHECRYCKEFQRDLFPILDHDYIEKGLLRYQVMLFPLQKYPESAARSAAVYCAAKQEMGIAMHEMLFTGSSTQDIAEALGMDTKAFQSCLTSKETTAMADTQRAMAQSLGVTVVPTFFLNGEKFVGLPYEADLRGRLETALQKVK